MDYRSLLGEVIGIGSNRTVHRHLNNNDFVIKVQRPKTLKKNKVLNNIMEWSIWEQYSNTKYEKLFCPCIEISEDGIYLIQRYAKVLSPGKHLKRSRSQWNQLPSLIKNYPDSRWYNNWGMLEDRYVIIDYGRENADRVRKGF